MSEEEGSLLTREVVVNKASPRNLLEKKFEITMLGLPIRDVDGFFRQLCFAEVNKIRFSYEECQDLEIMFDKCG